MPSPFPGMDPYLEAPDIWPDVHPSLANEIGQELHRRLPPPYYARVERRPEMGIVEDFGGRGTARKIVPDDLVVQPHRAEGGGVALQEPPAGALSKAVPVRNA